MKQQLKIWGSRTFALLLIVAAGQHWGVPMYKQYMTPKKENVYIPTTKVMSGEFVVSFHEMGTLKAEKSVPVMSEVNGKIIFIVGDGTLVTAGTKLAEMDTSDLEREVRRQQLELNNREAEKSRAEAEMEILKKQNQTEIDQAQAELDFNKTELEMAKEQFARMERLYKDKLVTRSEVDQAEMRVRSNELQVTKGEKSLELKKKEVQNKEEQKNADMRNSEYRLQLSKSELEDVERRVKKAVIMAPASGMVVLDDDWSPEGRRKLQAGDQVRPQQTIMSLPDLSSMLVKIALGEADAPKVEIGLPVLIRLEAVPKRIFHGTVKSISSLATEPLPWERTSSAGKSFEVIIAIKEVEPKTLKPGMTADVEFIRKSVKDALYVPLEAVIEEHGKTYVYVKAGETWKKTEIKVGTSNDNHVVVTKGLKADQVVALRDPTKPIDEHQTGGETSGKDEEQGKDEGKKGAVPIPDAKKK